MFHIRSAPRFFGLQNDKSVEGDASGAASPGYARFGVPDSIGFRGVR